MTGDFGITNALDSLQALIRGLQTENAQLRAENEVLRSQPFRPLPMYLTPTEAGEQLGLKRTTVYDQISKGRLTAVRVGSRLRVPSDALTVYKQKVVNR